MYYQAEGVEKTVHVARYSPVIRKFPIVDFVNKCCIAKLKLVIMRENDNFDINREILE